MAKKDKRGAYFQQWILIEGSRTVITGGFLALFLSVTFILIRLGVITVSEGSSLPLLLGSGIISGLLALITVTLSISQLILSRLFGSPPDLNDRLEGTIELHDAVEEIANESTSPNDPSAFLSMTADAINDQARALQQCLNEHDREDPSAIDSYAADVVDYSGRIGDTTKHTDIEISALKNAHSEYIKKTRRIRKDYGEEMTQEANQAIDNILSLLRSVAITHRYLETLFIHQELAQLSRFIAYTGLTAFVTTIYLALIYRFPSGGAVISAQYLPVVASVGLTVIISPLVVLVSYILRIATIAKYTVAIGPFTPLEEINV